METRLLSGIFGARSFAELAKALEGSVLQLGFRYFMFCGCFFGAGASEDRICFDNCPPGWIAYYRRYNPTTDGASFDLHDPREVIPTLWRQLSSRAPAFFAEARKYGLVTGCTHPVHGPDAHWSVLSFIKDRGGTQAEAEIDAALAECYLIAGYVHDAAARLARSPRDECASRSFSAPSRLNERERQVLTWAAAGMTAAQIAAVLPISRRTVIFHLSNARRKLGAANSTHAISMALSLGLIRTTTLEALQAPPARRRPAPGRSVRGM